MLNRSWLLIASTLVRTVGDAVGWRPTPVTSSGRLVGERRQLRDTIHDIFEPGAMTEHRLSRPQQPDRRTGNFADVPN